MHFLKRCASISESQGHAPIAQLDRVTDYESVGRGFESLSAYQKSRYPFGCLDFCFAVGSRTIKCECPVDIRWIPARRNPHYNIMSPFRRVPSLKTVDLPAFFEKSCKNIRSQKPDPYSNYSDFERNASSSHISQPFPLSPLAI